MSRVSVPCPACTADLQMQDRTCRSCGAHVPRAMGLALEERLAGSDPDYRHARQSAHRASILLVVVGLLYIGFGCFIFMVERSAGAISSEPMQGLGVAQLVENCAVGFAMLACFIGFGRAPAAALTAAIIIFLGVQVSVVVSSPGSILLAFLSPPALGLLAGKLVVLFLLVRGVRAVRRMQLIATNPPQPG
jgi:hypothetical protein